MTEPKHTADELRQWQSLPLNVKILMTQERIRQWVRYFGEDGVCVSFSGGKDSTVLLDIVRKMYPDVKAVFSNTGLEYPEIQRFVREHENVDVITPEMRFPEVLTKYGYPLIGKEVAEAIHYARKLRGVQRSAIQEEKRCTENAQPHRDKQSGEPQNGPHRENGCRGSKFEDWYRRTLQPGTDPTDRDMFFRKPKTESWEDWRRRCL